MLKIKLEQKPSCLIINMMIMLIMIMMIVIVPINVTLDGMMIDFKL